MTDKQTHAGGCLCGEVRYEVSGASIWRVICYCESCTRAAGAPAIAWAGFDKTKFRLLNGGLEIYESSPGVLRGFCRRCGTTLTYRKNPEVLEGAQDDVYIATRTLDDPDAYPPAEHVLYGERVSWFDVEDEFPHYDSLSAGHAHRQLATMSIKEEV
jgi:hypothetical protein